MALTGNYLTVRLQQHSSGVTNEIIAESTSVDAQFSAEALEATEQADALVANFVCGKTTIQVSGDYLLAANGEQFDQLFVHANAGNKIEVDLYRSGTLFLQTEGVLTSLSDAGGLSDSLVTGAYSMELDAVGTSLNSSTCVNGDYTTFTNATPNGFNATSNGAAEHEGGTVDEITIISGSSYNVTFSMVLNSGTAPEYDLMTSLAGSSLTSEGGQNAASGGNNFTFTATSSDTGLLRFRNLSTATDFEISNLSILLV